VRYRIIPALVLACISRVDVQAQWNVDAFGGYARTFQLSNINGGLELGAGIFYSFPHLTLGVEASSYGLGDNESTTTSQDIFPPFAVFTRRVEEERDGFRVTAIALKRLGNRLTLRGGLGYYRHTNERASEKWDSTGAVVEPRTVTKDKSRGPGATIGVGFNVLSLSNRVGLTLQLDSHFMFVKSSSGIDGYGFLHFANGGIRLSIGF
jgi:hypothetical protein